MTYRFLPSALLALAPLLSQPGWAADLPEAMGPGAAIAGPAPLPPARKRIRFDDGAIFHGDYLADYWSRPDAHSRGATPDLDAPGHVLGKPASFGGTLNQPGVNEMRRKLEAIFPRILSHAALAGIRGASLRPGAGFGPGRGGPVRHAVAAHATLVAYPIRLGAPETQKFPDGSFHTPGEGPVMRIAVNDTDELEGHAPIGTWNGMTVLRGGYLLVIPNTERPLYVKDESGRQVLNPHLVDISRPRADIQFMTVYVGAASSEHGEIVRQRVHPAAGIGRLVGVLYHTDWRSLLREVNDPR